MPGTTAGATGLTGNGAAGMAGTVGNGNAVGTAGSTAVACAGIGLISGNAWLATFWISGSACVPIPFAMFNADVACGIRAVAAFTAGATMEIAFGIKAASAGSASAPTGSPNPL